MRDPVYDIYEQLRDRYPLRMTRTTALDEAFTFDGPVLVGQAHGQILWLYEDCGEFILDVMDTARTMGTHWHPMDAEGAIADITTFMEGKADYPLRRFR